MTRILYARRRTLCYTCHAWTCDELCITPQRLAALWSSVAWLRPQHRPTARLVLLCNSTRLRRSFAPRPALIIHRHFVMNLTERTEP